MDLNPILKPLKTFYFEHYFEVKRCQLFVFFFVVFLNSSLFEEVFGVREQEVEMCKRCLRAEVCVTETSNDCTYCRPLLGPKQTRLSSGE